MMLKHHKIGHGQLAVQEEDGTDGITLSKVFEQASLGRRTQKHMGLFC